MKEELGISLEKATEDVLGTAAKVGAQMLTRKAVLLIRGIV